MHRYKLEGSACVRAYPGDVLLVRMFRMQAAWWRQECHRWEAVPKWRCLVVSFSFYVFMLMMPSMALELVISVTLDTDF